MQINKPTIGQLIERFLVPIKGREAQVELIRFMTRHLGMEPDSVSGFPRIDKVRDAIKHKLSKSLLETVQVNPGHELIYHHRAWNGGWEKGRKCRVVKVNSDRLTLDDNGRVNSQAVPLYCSELLNQVGVNIDFADLSRKASALQK